MPNPDNLRVPVSLVVKPIYLQDDISPKKKSQFDNKEEFTGIIKQKQMEMANMFNLPTMSASRTLPHNFKIDLK